MRTKEKEKKKKKKKIINIIVLLIAVASLITMCISIYNIIEWKIDNDKTKKQLDELEEKIEVVEKQIETRRAICACLRQ